MQSHMHLIDRVFAVSPDIRYVAIYRSGKLNSRQRGDVEGASASESDKYEELLVNPTLLKLITQRGNIDCGGAMFLVIRYGNFYQLVIDLPDGHLSVCFELSANPILFADQLRALCSAA
jgi:hypothetical protein